MAAKPKPFKGSPKRFHPPGLDISYEDHDSLVVNKAPGLLTMGNDKVQDRTAYYLLTDYVRKGNPKSKKRVFIVHRLDQDTSGVLVFAKSPEAKAFLQEEWSTFSKVYFAVVNGQMPKEEGEIESYLAENEAQVVYSESDPGLGKLSRTGYKVLETNAKYSLLEIQLHTGRKNQIRVHCAEAGCPVVGDGKYGRRGKGEKKLALHAAKLTLRHPHTKESMTFEVPIPKMFGHLMNR